jgi:surface antigen
MARESPFTISCARVRSSWLVKPHVAKNYQRRQVLQGKTMQKMPRSLLVLAISAALCLQGTGTLAADGGGLFSKKGLSQIFGGALGAAAGVLLAEKLAKDDGKRLGLSKEEIAKRKRGYAISLGLAGLAVGGALGGTVYDKLSEQGKKQREKALMTAAASAQVQRYGEPTAPQIAGIVTPGTPYQVQTSNQECIDLEDRLSEGGSADAIFVKMCRSLPNGQWGQVTT